MATSYTALLGLALPVTGELQGTWGDTVNNQLTSLLDTAVAGTTTISTDADVTLSTTTGAANQARQAIILWTANGSTTRNITAPAQSKTYVVINDSAGTQSIVIRGAGPTTGVTVVKGEKAVVAWNGSDFVKVSTFGGDPTFGNVTVTGTTTLSGLTASTALALNASKEVVSVTNTGTGNNVLSASPTLTGTVAGASMTLSSLTSGRVTYAGASGLLQDSANFTFNGTDLTVSGAVNAGSVNATTLDLTNLEVTNIKAKDGTASASIADSTGVMSLVANPVLSGGTANGVLYLDGSKVATSGSALTFDGTTLSVANGVTGGTSISLTGTYAGSGTVAFMNFQRVGGAVAGTLGYDDANNAIRFGTTTNHSTIFLQNNAEAMRLTSTGLGIGTSSPAQKLSVYYSANTDPTLTANAFAPVSFNNAGVELTYGVYTSSPYAAWLQTKTGGSAWDLAINPLGGNVGIGTSSPTDKLDVQGNVRIGATKLISSSPSAGNYNLTFQTYSGGFYDRMVLDYAGNLGIGTSSPASKLDVSGGDALIYGLTVGRGAGAVSTNTAVGASALAANTTGDNNTAVGYQAGTLLTTATAVTAFGSYSLNANTTGSDNTGIGQQALGNNTTGGQNTAIGKQAMQFNTTASNNTAVGYQAGYSNTTGHVAAAVGTKVLYANTTGVRNVALGGEQAGVQSGALASNTTGSDNIALGVGALSNNTTASDNIAVGTNALAANVTGIALVAIGRSALTQNTGSYNTAVGKDSLFSNTTASNNTAVGYQAAYSNTTSAVVSAFGTQAAYSNNGGYVDAFGYRTLYANTTGGANSGFGYAALTSNTTGANNTAVGREALNSNTTASNNTAVGYQAAYSNTTGTHNTAIGTGSLYTNTTAIHNTALGYYTLRNATGGGNTALGSQTGFNLTTGENNVFVGGEVTGYAAGLSNTTGSSNVFIGGYAGYLNTTGSSNVAVGIGASGANTTASYNIAVGYQSLNANQTGSAHVAVGHQALRDMTQGTYGSVGVGYQAGAATTTGDVHAFGTQALYQNTTGAGNTAVGNLASGGNTTGSNNTALGYQSMLNNNSGGENTAIGAGALYSMAVVSGYQSFCNTAVGRNAGFSLTTGNGNTLVGRTAGFSLTTGKKNTLIGASDGDTNYSAGYFITTGNSNVVLGSFSGNQGGLDIRTANNYIVLSDGDGNPRVIHDGTWLTNGTGLTALGNTQNVNYGTGLSFGAAGKGLLLQQTVNTNDERVYLTNNAQTSTSTGAGFTSQFAYNKTGASASAYLQVAGTHRWDSAGTGTAGGTISWTTILYCEKDATLSLQGGASNSGTGITFPATQNASSDANTLDDYEEGTFTATLKGGTTDPTTPVTATCTYTKIGKTVSVFIGFESVNTTGASGAIQITGLPFASDAGGVRPIGVVGSYGMATFPADTYLIATISLGATIVDIQYIQSAGIWVGATHNAGTGKYLWAQLTYQV